MRPQPTRDLSAHRRPGGQKEAGERGEGARPRVRSSRAILHPQPPPLPPPPPPASSGKEETRGRGLEAGVGGACWWAGRGLEVGGAGTRGSCHSPCSTTPIR